MLRMPLAMCPLLIPMLALSAASNRFPEHSLVDFLATLDPITRTFRVHVRLRHQACNFIRSSGRYPHHVRLQFDGLADAEPMFQIELPILAARPATGGAA